MNAAANEINSNIGPDFQMLDVFDGEFIDTEAVEDVDLMSVSERQKLNAKMVEWFG